MTDKSVTLGVEGSNYSYPVLDGTVGPEVIEDQPGIGFTATATLITPLAGGASAPTWPPGGGPAGSSGGSAK